MKILQFSCKESDKIDLRQADAVLKHRPDAIIFEAPPINGDMESEFNKFTPEKKPLKKKKQYQKMLLKISKKYKWVKSDVYVVDNIMQLWKSGHDVKIYNVDAPKELLKITIGQKWNLMDKPRRRGSLFSWWVYIYIREVIMAENISKIFKKSPKDSVVLVFLQKFHWLNVKFQLEHKNKKDIFSYYFGKFENVSLSNIDQKVKELGIPELYRFWSKYSRLN